MTMVAVLVTATSKRTIDADGKGKRGKLRTRPESPGRSEAQEWRAMKRVLTLVLLVATGVSCGGNDEDKKLFAQRQVVCDGLVAKGATVAQAKVDFQATGLTGPFNAFSVDCRSNFVLPGGSLCQANQSVCKIFWQTVAQDRSLCNSVSGGCVYACEVFTPGQGEVDVTDASTICASLFISGQPNLF
jgi:hypothetical protein